MDYIEMKTNPRVVGIVETRTPAGKGLIGRTSGKIVIGGRVVHYSEPELDDPSRSRPRQHDGTPHTHP